MAASTDYELKNKREIVKATQEIKALEESLSKLRGKAASDAKKRIDTLKEERKGYKEVLKGYKAVTEEYRDQIDLGGILAKSLKKQEMFSDSLVDNQKMLLKYGKSTAKLDMKVAKALAISVDNTANIQQNIENIGTAEFQN